MRTFLLTLMLLIASVGFADVRNDLGGVYDFGVSNNVDSFTKQETCRHRVDNSLYDDSGFTFARFHDGTYAVVIRRHWNNDRNTWVFNSYDERNAVVYVLFSTDEVLTRVPSSTDVEQDYEHDLAYFFDNLGLELVQRLSASTGDVRIRFSGQHGQRDFTINSGVIRALNEGFMRECYRR